jgi:hypothetical protein
MNHATPSRNAWQTFRSVYWTLAAAMAIVLVLLAALGFGPGGRKCQPASPTAAEGAAQVAAHQAPADPHACLKG